MSPKIVLRLTRRLQKAERADGGDTRPNLRRFDGLRQSHVRAVAACAAARSF
jgi:hypothetical protein